MSMAIFRKADNREISGRETDHVSRYSKVNLCVRDMQIFGNSIQSREVYLGCERRERSCNCGSEDYESFFPCCEGGVIFAFVFGGLGFEGGLVGGGDFYALSCLGNLFLLDDFLPAVIFWDIFWLYNFVFAFCQRPGFLDIDIVLVFFGQDRCFNGLFLRGCHDLD